MTRTLFILTYLVPFPFYTSVLRRQMNYILQLDIFYKAYNYGVEQVAMPIVKVALHFPIRPCFILPMT